jgi:RNA polymerase sigma-70 factor (ECF subfamily)
MLARHPLDDHPWLGAPRVRHARLGTERVERLLEETLAGSARRLAALRIVAGLTVEQVAHTSGKPAGAVKQLQRRGLAALRRRSNANGVGRTLSDSPDVHPTR